MNKPISDGKSLGFWSTLSIGIGGMVGGGIFAVLGLATQLARGGTPIAFALAGVVALITSYSYTHLSIAYPSQGGTVEFLNQAFGPGLLTGGLNILLWLSYVVMLSLYAYAFGSYGASFLPFDAQPFWRHVFITSAVLLLTGLNILGTKAVGKAEELIVSLKIAILILFVGAGVWSIDAQRLQPETWTPPLHMVTGGMIIFLAYEGFELIANTASDVHEPRKTLPRAYYFAVVFVILLYVSISLVTIGNLPFDQIMASQDYALAASAKPFLGELGFMLIAIAALLSTGSAINATLYGASRVSYTIAKDGELPKHLEAKVWNRPIEGLLFTASLTLLVANLFNLTGISIMGSAAFLLIFAAVNAANLRLHTQTQSRRSISLLGVLLCLGAFGALILQTTMTEPAYLWVVVAMITASFSIEAMYRWMTSRVLRPIYTR